MSRDLADRAFIIHLDKPEARPGWSEELSKFVKDHRNEILADIVAELRKPPYRTGARDRWQSWTDAVLSRCTDDPAAVVRMNQARRDECDDDIDEARRVHEAIIDHLAGQQSSVEVKYFVKSTDMTTVINTAFGTKWTAKKVANVINSHLSAGRLNGITKDRTGSSRGYSIWAP